MCGRFTLTRPGRDVAELLHLDETPEIAPRYNIAPTQGVLSVRRVEARREGVLLRWGLVPAWAPDLSIGAKFLNARAETIREKTTFRNAFARRRCLIPADGFYEWEVVGKTKQPIHFRLRDGGLFAMAGLWERWTGPTGVVESCTILTTTANDLIQPLHDRMPVILPTERHEEWLNPQNTDLERLQSLLLPLDAELMQAVRANTFVNNARHEGPGCLAAAEPLKSPSHQATLLPWE